MRFSLKKACAAVFIGGSSLLTMAFIGTEATGHDVCMSTIRDFNQQLYKPNEMPPSIIKADSYSDYDGKDGIWKIRLAATPFPFSNIAHTSLEILPFDAEKYDSRSEGLTSQIHGIIKRKDGTPSSVTPCDASSLYNQAAGNNLLKGLITKDDMNFRLLGSEPTLYIDLAYGTEEEISAMRDTIKEQLKSINDENIIYRFQSSPNSNSFIHALLKRLNIDIPTKTILSYTTAPGIDSNLTI